MSGRADGGTTTAEGTTAPSPATGPSRDRSAARRRVARLLRRATGHRLVDRLFSRTGVWLLPAVVLLGLFQVYPMLEVVRLSLTDTSLLDPTAGTYIGLAQFARLFDTADASLLAAPLVSDTAFWSSVRLTAVWAVSNVVLQVGLGFVVALAIDHGVRRRLVGHVTTRVAVLLAWVVPGIIVGLVWKILLIESRYGIVNGTLAGLGLGTVPFLTDPTLALVSGIAAGTWRGTAFSMIMLYAGLQNVPTRLHEAARMDGAGPLQRFRHVTLPAMKPVIFVTTVLVTIYSLNTFDLLFAMTNGGPGGATEVLSLLMYREGFREFNVGRAGAIAVTLLVINLVVAAVYLRVFDVQEEF